MDDVASEGNLARAAADLYVVQRPQDRDDQLVIHHPAHFLHRLLVVSLRVPLPLATDLVLPRL